MALIKCIDCGNEISDKAIKCPHCGRPINDIPKVDDIPKKVEESNNTIMSPGLTCSECGISINFDEIECKNCGNQLRKNVKKMNKKIKLGLIIGAIITFIASTILILNTGENRELFNLIALSIASLYLCILFWNLARLRNYFNIRYLFFLFFLCSFALLSSIATLERYEFAISTNTIVLVPNTINLTVDEAMEKLEKAGFSNFLVEALENNSTEDKHVISTQPNSGSYVQTDTFITIYIAANNQEKPTTNTNNNNNNNSTNSNSNNNNNYNYQNNNSKKTCDEAAKARLTNEYQTTITERTNKHNSDMEAARKQRQLIEETLELTGGYLSTSQYQEEYSAAQSDVTRKLLKARYEASQNYDSYVKTFDQLEPTFQKWKDTYTAWYNDELKKINCK